MEIQRAVPYLQVSDLAASLRFYNVTLGYAIQDYLTFEDGEMFWVALRNGDAHIMLSSLPVHDRSRLTWLYVEDADAAYAECLSAGYRPLTQPADQDYGCRDFLASGPDGEVYVIAHLL